MTHVHYAASVAPLSVFSAQGLSQEHLLSLAGGGETDSVNLTWALTVSVWNLQVSAIDFPLDKQSKWLSLMSLAHGHIIFPEGLAANIWE